MFKPGYTYDSNLGQVKIYDQGKMPNQTEECLIGALVNHDGALAPVVLPLDGHNVTLGLHLQKPLWLATESQRLWVINRLGLFASLLPDLDTRKWPIRARDLFDQTKKVFP